MLAGKPARPNPKWRLLAEGVEARMAAMGLPLEEWPDGSPPDPDHAERTLPVFIAEQGEILEALVEVGTSLGLCVYDDQAARVYLPFGYLLTWEGMPRLQPSPPKLEPSQLDAIISTCEEANAGANTRRLSLCSPTSVGARTSTSSSLPNHVVTLEAQANHGEA